MFGAFAGQPVFTAELNVGCNLAADALVTTVMAVKVPIASFS
jgi:hypothetical protein